MRPRFTILSVVFFLLACGSAYADKVTVDWDRQANFSQYKTYAWAPSKNPSENQLIGMRITQAVDSQLRARGLQKVEATENPDLTVAYDAGVQQKVSWVPYPVGPYWGWGWGPGPGPGPAWGWDWDGGWGWADSYALYPVVRDIGTLAVNIMDQHQKQLVWRGVASDSLKDNPDKNSRKIYELVEKMFKKYPPLGCCPVKPLADLH